MQTNPGTRNVGSHLVAIGILLLATGAAGYGGIKVAESRIENTSQWPSVQGRVVTSEVSTAVVRTGPVRHGTEFAKICYRYTVGGHEYECDRDRVVPMLHFKPEGTPEELVDYYYVGRRVDVYYDPNNPGDALLTPVPADDCIQLIHALALVSPCVAVAGLVIAAVAGVKQFSARRRDVHSAPVFRTQSEPMSTVADLADRPAPVRVPTIAAPARLVPVRPARSTHWFVRAAAVLIGLFLMLFGGPLCVTIAGTSDPRVSLAIKLVSLTFVGGAALLGAFLVYIGMRKPARPSAAAA